MMQLNPKGSTARDFSKFDVYIKTGGNGFSQITKYVVGISILLAVLMLTIR